jgi:hypothetical protein
MPNEDTPKPATGNDTPPVEDNPNVEVRSGKPLIIKRG